MSNTLDLKTELNRMINERKGASDNMLLDGSYKDLNTLKNDLRDMISIRSGNLKLNRRTCQSHVGTICTEHTYESYSDITEATSIKDALSIGDIDKALNALAYCTCDARQAPGCVCVSNTLKDYCACHARTNASCYCRSRDAGKYNHGPADCTCNSRYTTSCSCEGRTATNSCTCEGRCSCNVQKRFTMIAPNNDCTCDAKIESGCACNTVEISRECIYNYCTCVSRSSICACNAYAPSCSCYGRTYWIPACDGYYRSWGTVRCSCVSRTAICACNVDSICANHVIRYTVCDNNINPQYYTNVQACMCMNRCNCNTKSFYDS